MEQLLSIVIAERNQAALLPTLLDSIACQSFKELEVLVIDDASSEGGLEEVTTAYRNKGLEVRVHVCPERLYTKDARLKGVELARGEIVAFADADDEFTGTDTLERLLEQWLHSGCDTLHFRTLRRMAGEGQSYNAWADPFARELNGASIFEAYAQDLAGHVMWNKLYSRRLWLRHMEAARAVPISVCSEDFFLSTLYLFHARRYVGSDLTGYVHNYEDKFAVKSAGRAAAFFTMIQELPPYLEANGCSASALENLARHLRSRCRSYVNRACLEALRRDASGVTPYDGGNVFEDIPPAKLLELLLVVNRENATQLTSAARAFLS